MSFFYQKNIEEEIYAKANKRKQMNCMVKKLLLGLKKINIQRHCLFKTATL